MNEHDPQRNIVIVGGGFAGIELARRLERRLPSGWQATLLSQDNFVTYNPLLPEVVGASVLPGHVVAPLAADGQTRARAHGHRQRDRSRRKRPSRTSVKAPA